MRWRRSVPRRGLAGDEGTGHSGAPEALEIARVRSGRFGGLNRGHHTGAKAPEGAAHSEAG
jgi:hypothetical protein